MKLFQKLVCMALTATATASLSICAFAADYTFDTAADTDYYPSTSYEDTYGTAYHYGSKNLVDYQIPELPYGVLSTTQTGVMEKLQLPGLQQTVGGSASGIYGVDSGVGILCIGAPGSYKSRGFIIPFLMGCAQRSSGGHHESVVVTDPKGGATRS